MSSKGLVVEIRTGDAAARAVSSLSFLRDKGWKVLEMNGEPGSETCLCLLLEKHEPDWDHALSELGAAIDGLFSARGFSVKTSAWQVMPWEYSRHRHNRGVHRVTSSWYVTRDRHRVPDHLLGLGARCVYVDAGWAFGDGCHPSTRASVMALEWMESRGFLRGKRVLDVGTGTGILAMIAARAGAESVLGIDVDQEAVFRARRNVAANDLTEWVTISGRSIENLDSSSWNVALANLTVSVLYRILPRILAILTDDAKLVIAGFKESGYARIEALLEENSVRPAWASSAEGWGVMICKRF